MTASMLRILNLAGFSVSEFDDVHVLGSSGRNPRDQFYSQTFLLRDRESLEELVAVKCVKNGILREAQPFINLRAGNESNPFFSVFRPIYRASEVIADGERYIVIVGKAFPDKKNLYELEIDSVGLETYKATCRSIIGAVTFLYEKGYVLADLNPSGILVDSDGSNPIIIDASTHRIASTPHSEESEFTPHISNPHSIAPTEEWTSYSLLSTLTAGASLLGLSGEPLFSELSCARVAWSDCSDCKVSLQSIDSIFEADYQKQNSTIANAKMSRRAFVAVTAATAVGLALGVNSQLDSIRKNRYLKERREQSRHRSPASKIVDLIREDTYVRSAFSVVPFAWTSTIGQLPLEAPIGSYWGTGFVELIIAASEQDSSILDFAMALAHKQRLSVNQADFKPGEAENLYPSALWRAYKLSGDEVFLLPIMKIGNHLITANAINSTVPLLAKFDGGHRLAFERGGNRSPQSGIIDAHDVYGVEALLLASKAARSMKALDSSDYFLNAALEVHSTLNNMVHDGFLHRYANIEGARLKLIDQGATGAPVARLHVAFAGVTFDLGEYMADSTYTEHASKLLTPFENTFPLNIGTKMNGYFKQFYQQMPTPLAAAMILQLAKRMDGTTERFANIAQTLESGSGMGVTIQPVEYLPDVASAGEYIHKKKGIVQNITVPPPDNNPYHRRLSNVSLARADLAYVDATSKLFGPKRRGQ